MTAGSHLSLLDAVCNIDGELGIQGFKFGNGISLRFRLSVETLNSRSAKSNACKHR